MPMACSMHVQGAEAMVSTRHSWSDAEELIVYLALVAVGAIPVGIALAHHSGLGAEATIGLLMIVGGIIGLTYLAWSRRDRTT